MQSPCLRELSQACFHGCCLTPSLGLPEPPNPKSKSESSITTTTVKASRIDFTTATVASLFPNTQFTNHESLPSLSESFSQFTEAYPQYNQSEQADHIRAEEYQHLSFSNHVCLDYIGLGLFSHSQLQAHCSSAAAIASSSSSSPPPPPPHNSALPFFDISYKAANLDSQILYGGQQSELETKMTKRIMDFLNISETDYQMVFTANRASAFKLLAESYPFQSHGRLLTVYDYQSEAVGAMIEKSQKRGARVMSAEFSWPSMRIHSAKLRKMLVSKKKKNKGMFVFPLQSRMSGTRYSYQWMNLAQENGWHVVLDACALGPKDMDTLGLSLFRPDFLISSFFKVFGENPSGFGCLFVKKSSVSVLEASSMARSIGIVSLVPAKREYQLRNDSSGTKERTKYVPEEDDLAITSSFSGPLSGPLGNELGKRSSSPSRRQFEEIEHGETSTETSLKQQEPLTSEIVEIENSTDSAPLNNIDTTSEELDGNSVIECRGLDHADTLGLRLICNRERYLINWLVNALMKLQHPHSENGIPLIRIYGPKIKFDRGPAVAFNVFDWKGERMEPLLVQKLADRSNISLSYGFMQNISFSDKYNEEKEIVLQTRTHEAVTVSGNKRKEKDHPGITVVTAALGFLTNFEDIYRFWAFVAQFLDADFVEKERWRYMALDQKIIEV